jgi:hypothetical protein
MYTKETFLNPFCGSVDGKTVSVCSYKAELGHLRTKRIKLKHTSARFPYRK